MGSERPKQYLSLAGHCVLSITLARLHMAWPQARILLCLAPDDQYFQPDMVPEGARWQRIDGGDERADSVWKGLQAIAAHASPIDWVAVHDVARPCIHPAELARCASLLSDEPVGGLLAIPAADTMKRAWPGQQRVHHTESRTDLWQALTPQFFRYGILAQAMATAQQRAQEKGHPIAAMITDEASAVEALGYTPLLWAGRRDNIKITHPEDLPLAEQILAAQRLTDYTA